MLRAARIRKFPRNAEFLVNTQHVTLKSPKMGNDDDKPSNYRLMIFFAVKPFFLILANL